MISLTALGAYYSSQEFHNRGDCIYRRQRNGVFVRRGDALFHTAYDHRATDLGPPPRYPKAVTLVSDDFRYFGVAGTEYWKAISPKLRLVVEHLGQGHRVNHDDVVTRELLA